MKAKKLAKEIGLDKVEEIGSWKGYEVLVATSDQIRCLGLPQYILQQEKNARWATPEETLELMSIFCV